MRAIAIVALLLCVVVDGGMAEAGLVSLYNWQEANAGSASTSAGAPYTEFFDLEHAGVVRDDFGNSYSQTIYNFRDENGQAVFDWDFEHSHDAQGQGSAAAYLEFEVDSSTAYSLSGVYNQNGAPYVLQDVELYDADFNTVFTSFNLNTSASVTGVQFQVGTPYGGPNDFVIGDSSGMLGPGKYYLLAFHETALYSDQTYGPSYAEGSFRFTLGSPAAVPEPSSMLLLGIGLSGVFMSRRRLRFGLRQGQ